MKHTIMCSCDKLAIKCKEASEALTLIVTNAKKEVFDDIEKINHRLICDDCKAEYANVIRLWEIHQLRDKHLNTSNLQAKKEVFDDMKELWKRCQNHDLRGLMLNDIEEMEKKHLNTSNTEKVEGD